MTNRVKRVNNQETSSKSQLSVRRNDDEKWFYRDPLMKYIFLLEDTKEFKIMYKKFKVALTS